MLPTRWRLRFVTPTTAASTTNQDPERRIRLSTDIRYQNVDDEIDARWNNHWSLNDML